MALETVFIKDLKVGDKFANMLPKSEIYTVTASHPAANGNPNSWLLTIVDQNGKRHSSTSHKNNLVTKIVNHW